MKELETLTHTELTQLLEVTKTSGWALFERLLVDRLKNLADQSLTTRPIQGVSFEFEHGRWYGQAELVNQAIKPIKELIPEIIRAKEAIAK